MLELKLEDLFNAQMLVDTAADSLATNPTDSTFKLAVSDTVVVRQSEEEALEVLAFEPVNLLKNYKGIDKDTVRVSYQHYSRFGAEYLVENLSRSSNWILQTCEEPLRNKIMESRGPLILKLMLEIIMDVDNSDLRALTTSLQTLWFKDAPGENVCTAVSYLKRGFDVAPELL